MVKFKILMKFYRNLLEYFYTTTEKSRFAVLRSSTNFVKIVDFTTWGERLISPPRCFSTGSSKIIRPKFRKLLFL